MSQGRSRGGPGAVAAWIAAVLLLAVAVFQLALVVGAPWGRFTQGGGNEGALPVANRVVALVSLVVVLAMAAAILARVGIGPLRSAPRRLVTGLAWFTTVYAGIAVVANLATPSAGERAVFAPLSAVLFACIVVAMVRSRASRRAVRPPSSA